MQQETIIHKKRITQQMHAYTRSTYELVIILECDICSMESRKDADIDRELYQLHDHLNI